MKTTTIEFDLSARGINKAIKQLEAYKKRLQKKLEELLDAMAEKGEQYANLYYTNAGNGFDYVDSYETVESIMGYREGNKAIISVGGAAVWIEFGTGVTYNTGGDQYHTNRYELGMNNWGHYEMGQGRYAEGWWYWKNNRWNHTYGLPENPFMALTATRLKAEFRENAQKVFSK